LHFHKFCSYDILCTDLYSQLYSQMILFWLLQKNPHQCRTQDLCHVKWQNKQLEDLLPHFSHSLSRVNNIYCFLINKIAYFLFPIIFVFMISGLDKFHYSMIYPDPRLRTAVLSNWIFTLPNLCSMGGCAGSNNTAGTALQVFFGLPSPPLPAGIHSKTLPE
ncbi:hypothetical protein L9F63_024406, partial [Diploptera punctata]